LKYDFKDASIKRIVVKLPIPGYGAVLAEESSFFTLGQTSKKLYQFSLPEEPPKKVRVIFMCNDTNTMWLLVSNSLLKQQQKKMKKNKKKTLRNQHD
jgi:hypothetical protein